MRAQAFHLNIFMSILVSVCSTQCLAQDSSGNPGNDNRPVQAMEVIQRAASATGWTQDHTPSDVVAHGSVQFPTSDDTTAHPVIYKAKGTSRFRWENGADPEQTTVANFETRSASGPRGRPIPVQAFGAWHLPFLSNAFDITNGNHKIEFLGIENIGEQAYKIRILQTPPERGQKAKDAEDQSPVVWWISASTFLPLQVEYRQAAETNRFAYITRTRRYSDYRQVDKMLVPFRQEEYFAGNLIYTIQLTDVSFDVGLSDAEFRKGGR